MGVEAGLLHVLDSTLGSGLGVHSFDIPWRKYGILSRLTCLGGVTFMKQVIFSIVGKYLIIELKTLEYYLTVIYAIDLKY